MKYRLTHHLFLPQPFHPGACDAAILDLVEELGWLDELRQRRHLLPEACLQDPRMQ